MNSAGPHEPLQTPVQFVKGVGPYIASLLEKKGIKTVLDLCYYFPSRYLDRRKIDTIRKLQPGKERCIIGQVVGIGTRQLGRSRRRICEMVVSDQTGVAVVLWFHFNESYIKKKYSAGKKLLIFGECQFYGAQKQFTHPEIEEWEEEPNQTEIPVVPVYPLTEGLYQKTIRRIIFNALDHYLCHL